MVRLSDDRFYSPRFNQTDNDEQLRRSCSSALRTLLDAGDGGAAAAADGVTTFNSTDRAACAAATVVVAMCRLLMLSAY